MHSALTVAVAGGAAGRRAGTRGAHEPYVCPLPPSRPQLPIFLSDLTAEMPGAKPPQPEAPAPPVKVETTAAALQLLQPKAIQISSAAASHGPAAPPAASKEPAPILTLSSAVSASERIVPSDQTAAAEIVHATAAAEIVHAPLAVPPPSSASAVAVLRDADVHAPSVPPASDDETHSDASDGSDSQEELDQEPQHERQQEPQQLSAKPVPAHSVGAFNGRSFIFTRHSHMRIFTESSEDSESEDEITKASKQ